MSRWLRVRTRLDRPIAVVLLVVSMPALVVCALWVRLEARPALVRVPRIGRGGRAFDIWKVRTMRPHDALGRAAGTAIAAGDDARVTAAGRHLRRLHLDELPQLLQVIQGQMALIGPRPEAPAFVDADQAAWQTILSCPPGMAGPTQVLVGRWEARELLQGDAEVVYRSVILPVKLAIDEWYVRQATPWIDVLVAVALLSGREDRLRRVIGRAVPAARLVPSG